VQQYFLSTLSVQMGDAGRKKKQPKSQLNTSQKSRVPSDIGSRSDASAVREIHRNIVMLKLNNSWHKPQKF